MNSTSHFTWQARTMSAMKMKAPRSTLTNSGSLSFRSSYNCAPRSRTRALISSSVYKTFRISCSIMPIFISPSLSFRSLPSLPA